MNEQSLINALAEERSIFRQFSMSESLGDDAEMFWADANNLHWNSLYPTRCGQIFSAVQLSQATAKYQSVGRSGYVITTSDKWQVHSAETEYYFIYSHPDNVLPMSKEFIVEITNDIDTFSEAVSKAFFPEDLNLDFFKAKMKKLSLKEGSQFYIVKKNGQIAGTGSTFKTMSGHNFLFNIGTLPDFRGEGVASAIIQAIASKSSDPLYTYSPTLAMYSLDEAKPGILLKSGFDYIGRIHKVPLEVYKEQASLLNGP